MPNVAAVLKEEIQRLARKEAKSALESAQSENRMLKREVADLRKRLDAMERQGGGASSGGGKPRETAAQYGARVTGDMIRKTRERFEMTQSELAHMLDVSAQTVYTWEKNLGKLNLRERTLEAVLEIRDMGKREAQRILEMRKGEPPAAKQKKKPGPKPGTKRTTGKKPGPKPGSKRKSAASASKSAPKKRRGRPKKKKTS